MIRRLVSGSTGTFLHSRRLPISCIRWASSSSSSSRQRDFAAKDDSAENDGGSVDFFRFPAEPTEARLFVRDLFHRYNSTAMKVASKATKFGRDVGDDNDVIGVRRHIQRAAFHYLRTQPDFFGFRSDLFVLRLSACEDHGDIQRVIKEMEAAGIAMTSAHYSAAMLTLALSQDQATTEKSMRLFAHARATGEVDTQLWSDLFLCLSVAKVSPTMFDSWWDVATGDEQLLVALPISLFQNAINWCSERSDVERALKVWSQLQRKIVADGDNVPITVYGALMAVAEELQHDGGFKQSVLDHIKKKIDAGTLEKLTWRDIAPFLKTLSVDAALSVVQHYSKGQDADVPFAVWMLLLRRLCGERRIAEAEALFHFLASHSIASRQKNAMVTEMMRMYANLRPPDADSVINLFVDHIAEPAEGAPHIAPNAVHYDLLLRVSDSTAMTTSIFLEASAEGVSLPDSSYEAMFRAGGSDVKRLERTLPEDRYERASDIDQFIKVPADADPHAARDRAQEARGKEAAPSV